MDPTIIEGTEQQPLTGDELLQLAETLTGLQAKDLIKVRATQDSLVVIIHTGQKFVYLLEQIEAALAALTSRPTPDDLVVRTQLDADVEKTKAKAKGKGKSKP